MSAFKEEILQAVVLADSFQTKLRPITYNKPKVLLPLANVPMINYTLEFLVSNKVKEIFVFCPGEKGRQVKEYLEQSRWCRQNRQFKLEIVTSDKAFSAGDALRHLFHLDCIKSHFILLSGDVVSNMRLKTVLKEHRARYEQDKNNVMTIVFKKAGHRHRTRTLVDDTVVALNRETGQLLHFDDDFEEKAVRVDATLFEEHRALQFRYDLLDTYVDICAPEVLSLFEDNFDYQSLRKDFVVGVLGSDILGNKINTHVISGEYTARLQDFRTYDSISKDILSRWSFPMVPDNNLLVPTTFGFSRHNVYKEDQDISIARSAVVDDGSLVGTGCTVGAGSSVLRSVLGRNTKIGCNAKITGSYLWQGCVVEDNVTMDRAIVCDGAIIRSGSVLENGVVVDFGVEVAAGTKVAAHSKLTNYKADDDGEWGSEDEEEDEDLRTANSLAPCPDAFELTNHSDEEIACGAEESEEEKEDVVEQDPIIRFNREMLETFQRGVADDLPVDAIQLEMASLKLTHDANTDEYAYAALRAMCMLSHIPCGGEPEDVTATYVPTNAHVGAFKALMEHWKTVITKFGREESDQLRILTGWQNVCLDYKLTKLFQIVLQMLYDQDVVSEEVILTWEARELQADGPGKTLVQAASQLLEWLKEADSDDDEGDTSSGDETE